MNFADGNGTLEIVIYAVVMVAGLAASAYRNYKKRMEQQKIQTGESMADSTEPTFHPAYDFEEITDEEATEEESFEEDVIAESVEKEPDLSFREQVIAKMNLGSEKQVAPETLVSENMSGNNTEALEKDFFGINDPYDIINTENTEENDDFDLRKAVIYSEIMNPKYL